MQELIRMLPDGASAVAVIIVVMLFLKQHDKVSHMLECITKGYNDQIADSQQNYQEQVLHLAGQQFDTQKRYQDQIQNLIDAHIKVAHETIAALKSLESTIDIAKDRGDLHAPKE